MATVLSHQTSLLSLWCDTDITKDLLLPPRGRDHPSPWDQLHLLGHCSCRAKCPSWCHIAVQGCSIHVVLTAGSFTSDILGCSPQGLKVKGPFKHLQHWDPVREEGWEVLLNIKNHEQVAVVKRTSNFLHSPLKLRTTLYLKNNNHHPWTCFPGTGGWPSSLSRCWLCGSPEDHLPGALTYEQSNGNQPWSRGVCSALQWAQLLQ